MILEHIDNTIEKLTQLMQGFNYEVEFDFFIFVNCNDVMRFNNEIKAQCSEFLLDSNPLIWPDINEFWNRINYGLTYRGEPGAGLTLNKSQEDELEIEQTKYKNFIQQFVNDQTKIYSSSENNGVYWGFKFFLRNLDNSLYISGYADD